MKSEIVFVKPDGTEVSYDSMTIEEKQEQGEKLAKRFMERLGYEEITRPP